MLSAALVRRRFFRLRSSQLQPLRGVERLLHNQVPAAVAVLKGRSDVVPGTVFFDPVKDHVRLWLLAIEVSPLI